MSNLRDVATDVYDLLSGREFRLTHEYVARQLHLCAIDVLQSERTVQAVLRPVPYVSERNLLQHHVRCI